MNLEKIKTGKDMKILLANPPYKEGMNRVYERNILSGQGAVGRTQA